MCGRSLFTTLTATRFCSIHSELQYFFSFRMAQNSHVNQPQQHQSEDDTKANITSGAFGAIPQMNWAGRYRPIDPAEYAGTLTRNDSSPNAANDRGPYIDNLRQQLRDKFQPVACNEIHLERLIQHSIDTSVETPIPLLQSMHQEASGILDNVLRDYSKVLGENHVLTKEANEHFEIINKRADSIY